MSNTFGFHLATLDLRQHAEVHHRVIAQGLDDPNWMARTPAERHDLLVSAIERDAGVKMELDALGRRTLGVFEAILQARHRYGRDAIGYYIVSGTQGADDVLAPLLLARWAEAYDRVSGEVAVDIAPMFESVEALEQCGDIMRTLLGDPLYRRHLDARGRTQCALIGYSDSNKESGLCASRFAAYRAQADLSTALSAANESHVIFHARGGSVARGGSRIDTLVRTAPVGTHQRRAAHDRAGRGHQPELRAQADRHAYAGARLQCARPIYRRRRHRQSPRAPSSCSSQRGSQQ